MLKDANEKTLVNILFLGSALVTIFVVTGIVTDPVNATKHFILGGVAFASFAIAAIFAFKTIWADSKFFLLLSTAFLLLAIFSVVSSKAPLEQNLYGAYGRNTGFIAYLSLVLIALASLALRRKASFQKIIVGLFIAGFINVAYCLWAWQIGDFIGWSNPYNTILGTFGNPNFIGAFLGIFLSALIAYVAHPGSSLKFRLLTAFTFIIGLLEIRHSHAVQGVAVTAAGLSIVGFYVLRSKVNSIITFSYVAIVFIVGITAVLGALQKGPLAQYIYKTSVSLRGEYWQAGINMAKEFPLTGVGMDSYGDWYRRLRDSSALIMPGPNTVTNAAHNVNFDILAYGGWILFATYLALVFTTVVAVIKVTLRQKNYDPIFVSLAVGWACYQVQALISINQIGLAIWGWLLSGVLVAYEVATRPNKANSLTTATNRKSKISSGQEVFSPQLIAGLGLVLGSIIAVPPLSADMNWRSALQSQNQSQVEVALQPSYLNPPSSSRLANAVQLFEQSNLPDIAYRYARQGVEYNPDYFDAWKVLYFISKSTQADKEIALENMKRLDPKNKNVLDVPKA
jgi:O-antigen ligase